jgi:5-methylcytosine-specific restriction protein A
LKRPFRTEESIHAEKITRESVVPFLATHGFQHLRETLKVSGSAINQLISAKSPQGERMKIRVRLCWRRRSAKDLSYSAAQLSARLVHGDWNATLEKTMQRDLDLEITHNLLLQRDGAFIVFAALIPSGQMKGIFDAQARVSQELIDSGQMKNMRKNHSKNGSSPTIWLMDTRTPEAHRVADVLWNWEGVADLTKLPIMMPRTDQDAIDDCTPPSDYSNLGNGAPVQRYVLRAEFPRDRKVREAVLDRTDTCERQGCSNERAYDSFLDVHHILGIKMGDQVWNCVALCPNCHRDAHFSPEADRINLELLQYAARFENVEN